MRQITKLKIYANKIIIIIKLIIEIPNNNVISDLNIISTKIT